MRFAWNLYADETGASLTEYAMLLALIAVSTLAAVHALRDQTASALNSSASTLGTVN